MVEEARPVVFVPNGMAPSMCGLCQDNTTLNWHNVCAGCMTWYCPCCVRRYEGNLMKQQTKQEAKKTLDESIADLQTLAAKQAWYLGFLFGGCTAGAIFKYSENSGLTGFFTMAMVLVAMKHLYNLARFRGHKLEFKTRPADV